MRASVVIPTYYRPYDLSRLLESLIGQYVKPSEVLVIDDTPTTEIKTLCEEYAISFDRMEVAFVYVKKKPSERSCAISRNIGAKKACGDVVLFMDSDLILYPDYIEKVLRVFSKYPEALGVGSFINLGPRQQLPSGIRYHSNQVFLRLFSLMHDSRNSCRFFQYPIVLSRTIYCQWLLGGSMSFKRSVFSEFQFDENLKGLAWGEDFLFSSSIQKRYPRSLLITPDAKCIHTWSKEARLEGKDLAEVKMRNSKYVLTKLWGSKGLLIFGRQSLGLWFFRVMARFKLILSS